MALFTMRLKDVLKHTDNIGLNGYPIFDEAYRDTLNGKIVDRYFNREIGMETIDMFQLAMRRKMNEIMPLYNKLYLSEQMKFDPLHTIDVQTVTSGTAQEAGTNTNTATGTANATETGTNSSISDDTASGETHSDNTTSSNTRSRAVTSDTPQTMLSGDEDYASGASDSASETTGTGGQDETTSATSNSTSSGEDARESDSTTNSTSNGEDARESESLEDARTTGRQGMLGSEALMKYRESLLNIDVDIIDDLNELFMKIWSSGDEYHSHAFPFGNWSMA